MTNIQADYIKFTAPEIEQPFIAALKKVPVFSRLTDPLLAQLFEYSRFSMLKDKEQPIQSGKFGQNIYMLIQGRLEVFLKDESGQEKLTDVIFRPFSIFGEQCLMGEPYNMTIESVGETVLLAIDMSALPDLFDGWENPENLMDDQNYQQSLDLNTIIASVLLSRLNRLIKDQYKLVQKLVILHQSKEYQASWRQNVLLTTMFNEFTQNQLSTDLEVGDILRQTLELYIDDDQPIFNLISQKPVDTEKVYMELTRLASLGIIDNMNILLMETIQRLAMKAGALPEYTKGLELEPHNLPAIISLAEYLDEAFLTIIESGVLSKDMSKEEFLTGFLNESYPEPSRLINYLNENGLVDSVFRSTYLTLLICQTCVRKEYELSKLIAKCVAYLTDLNAPRQDVARMQKMFVTNSQSITAELMELYHRAAGQSDATSDERQKTGSPGDDVEDLLSRFNL